MAGGDMSVNTNDTAAQKLGAALDRASHEAVALAEYFHNIYEELAPSFGYVTREDTRKFDPSSQNGKLMAAVCQRLFDLRGVTPEGRETNEQFAEREAKIIMDSADAQCFRWLLKHHSGTGKAIAGTGMRCWIGGVEFNGEDVRDAIDAAMERK